MRNRFSIVGIAPLMACAATGVGQPVELARPIDVAPLRGVVETTGIAVQALRAGPVVIHAYSGFRGGGIYTVPVVIGTDADCVAQRPAGGSGGPDPLEADQRMTVRVPAGELACLETDTKGRFELLWHAHQEAPAKTSTIAAAPNAGEAR